MYAKLQTKDKLLFWYPRGLCTHLYLQKSATHPHLERSKALDKFYPRECKGLAYSDYSNPSHCVQRNSFEIQQKSTKVFFSESETVEPFKFYKSNFFFPQLKSSLSSLPSANVLIPVAKIKETSLLMCQRRAVGLAYVQA